MKLKNLHLLVALAALTTLNSELSTAFAQGALTPPGAPAPTMKTLAQIEPRTPISSVPFTITQPGSYYLTTNVTTAVSNAIVIAANGVTLDLNGFTISSTVANAANGGAAILFSGVLKDITILNGHIRGGVTNNGINAYGGSGFDGGIVYSGNVSLNVRVSGLSVSGCLTYGIFLGVANSSVVESCTVRTIGNTGIRASTIKSSAAEDCAVYGINCEQVSDCHGEATDSIDSTGISAITASNCYGSSNGSSGKGISAQTANNCYGNNNSSGTGLSATDVANGCRGSSSSGVGLSGFIANACHGSGSPSLLVAHNINSF